MEQWKDVEGYEGLYIVSNYGRIKSLPRETTKGKIIKQMQDKDGYFKVCLSKNNIRKTHFVHRLVATAFIKKPFDKNIINHIDENKQNNCVLNLEWCTTKYNNTYNNGQERRGIKRRRKVIAQINSVEIIFDSVGMASKITGVNRHNISSCLTKYRKSAGGFKWRYADE